MNIRALQLEDLSGLENLLEAIDAVPPPNMITVFGHIACSPWNTVLVAVADNRIVGCLTVFIEMKFVHDGGLVGHIEDVAVHPDYRKRGIARGLVLSGVSWAKKNNCYKVVLACRQELVGLYEACGFRPHEVQMRLNLKH